MFDVEDHLSVAIPGVLELALRLPDNKRLQRRFKADAELGGVAAFVQSSGVDMTQHVIIRSFPRKVLAVSMHSLVSYLVCHLVTLRCALVALMPPLRLSHIGMVRKVSGFQR